ncbi:multicopper oxidase domain-containing protein [Proteobacteria bacterium 005FR1]|nr:multicopper oxidase domain-containing protein [Proteobacteria bacterium 005FR1]
MFSFNWCRQLSRAQSTLLALSLVFSATSLSQEAPQEKDSAVKRDIPYEGAFGPPKPPRPPLSDMQTPIEPWVMDAIGVWYERPSPKGPEPIPLDKPEAIYIEGGGPVIQVLPGPPAFPEKIPKRLQTVFPKKVPFSNNVKKLSQGTFRAVAYDRTLNDTKISDDEMSVEISFTDFQGEQWRIEQVTLAPISPNPILEPWFGGLMIDRPYHGHTGNGTPAEPLVRCMLCSWGWADIYQNDKRVASSALLHIMLTSDVRGDDFKYMCYECQDKPVREVHVIVPPSAYLPSPGGFLHIMWEDSSWERGSPEQIASLVPQGLEEQVPTIELSAVPYLAWDKAEIPVEAGKKYRLIVHNNDPSSFHQFHLHSHPGEEGHHESDLRHEHGSAAGGVGPLWKPDQKPHSQQADHGSPPAPAAVFFPLPQGSTWATFVQFDKPGEYEFMCPVANHYRRGMEGKFIVTEAGQQQAEAR